MRPEMRIPATAERLSHYSTDESEPLFFYGGPFSNFHISHFTAVPLDFGLCTYYSVPLPFITVEHWFQAHKAIGIDDFWKIRSARDPGMAKSLGNRVDLRSDWEKVKYAVMVVGVRFKFEDPYLRSILLGTGDRRIAEDSPTDDIWGIRDERGGFTGKNLLGRALMQVRHEIRTSTFEPLTREPWDDGFER